MLPPGPATKVTIYLNQDTASAAGFLQDDIMGFLSRQGVPGATVLRPHAGFGTHRLLHSTALGASVGTHLPVIIQFIETTARTQAFLPALLALVTDGLVEAQPTEVLKHVSSAAKVIS